MANNKQSKNVTYKGFFHLPAVITSHIDFISLSPHAIKLLVDLGTQYNGRNNGDLCAAMNILKNRNWTSNDTITKKLRELEDKGWITKTRQGGLGMGPNLYALTWQPINECGGKLDVSPTTNPPRKFN